MLLFSDLHLREESEDTVFEEVLPGILQAALDRNEKVIACLGDVLHFRHRVVVRLMNRLRDELRRWGSQGIEVIILPGNHDQIDYQGRNALEHLDDLKNVSVYTEPQWDEHGLWIPYRKRNEDIEAALRISSHAFPRRGVPPMVAFMHCGVRDAWMNDNIQDSEGLPASVFQTFNRVLCGHYHKHQDVGGKISYIGSPYQTKADEAGQNKGYAIWDGQNLEYVMTHWGKRYHRFELKSGQELDLSGVDPKDEVRVTTAAGVDPDAIGKALAKAGIERHTVTPAVQVSEQRLDVGDGASMAEYAVAYVSQQETSLDSDKLMGVFTELSQ